MKNNNLGQYNNPNDISQLTCTDLGGNKSFIQEHSNEGLSSFHEKPKSFRHRKSSQRQKKGTSRGQSKNISRVVSERSKGILSSGSFVNSHPSDMNEDQIVTSKVREEQELS